MMTIQLEGSQLRHNPYIFSLEFDSFIGISTAHTHVNYRKEHSTNYLSYHSQDHCMALNLSIYLTEGLVFLHRSNYHPS